MPDYGLLYHQGYLLNHLHIVLKVFLSKTCVLLADDSYG